MIITFLQSKAVVLKSMSNFLRKAIASRCRSFATSNESIGAKSSTWYLEPSFATAAAYQEFIRLLIPSLSTKSDSRRCWQKEVDLESGAENFILCDQFVKRPVQTALTVRELSDAVSSTNGLMDVQSNRETDLLFVAVCDLLSLILIMLEFIHFHSV
jgi:hypothetical protein